MARLSVENSQFLRTVAESPTKDKQSTNAGSCKLCGSQKKIPIVPARSVIGL